ncbi:MAG: hypothetical protein ACFB50_17015 [Rubrobacteraceae bacterium]
MRGLPDRAKVTLIVVAAGLLVLLLFVVNALPVSAVIEPLAWVAGLSVGVGIVYLLTLSGKWRKPVAGALALAVGLVIAGLLWLAWTVFNAPSVPEWVIRAARNLPEAPPGSRIGSGVQVVSGLMFGILIASLRRLFQKPALEKWEKQEFRTALLMAGVGFVIILLIFVFSSI